MRGLVRVYLPSTGPQLFLGGIRCHHGAVGCLVGLAGLASGNRVLAAVGVALMIHDRADIRVWF